MEHITLAILLNTIAKKLHPLLHDDTLCAQYAEWITQIITKKNELELLSTPFIWNSDHQKTLDSYLDKLLNQHMPLAYIIGSTPFAGLDIMVRPPILIPRPETEEWCIDLINQLTPLSNETLYILDIGTGSGCIALALADALPKAKIFGIDRSNAALVLAKENAHHNHIPNVEFFYSNLFEQIPSHFTFDLIVSNPPYIDPAQWNALDPSVKNWEDKQALIAPDHGLAIINQIIKSAPSYLRANPLLQSHNIPQLVMEIDSTQAAAVVNSMQAHHYHAITIKKDLEKKDRVITGRIDHVAPAPAG